MQDDTDMSNSLRPGCRYAFCFSSPLDGNQDSSHGGNDDSSEFSTNPIRTTRQTRNIETQPTPKRMRQNNSNLDYHLGKRFAFPFVSSPPMSPESNISNKNNSNSDDDISDASSSPKLAIKLIKITHPLFSMCSPPASPDISLTKNDDDDDVETTSPRKKSNVHHPLFPFCSPPSSPDEDEDESEIVSAMKGIHQGRSVHPLFPLCSPPYTPKNTNNSSSGNTLRQYRSPSSPASPLNAIANNEIDEPNIDNSKRHIESLPPSMFTPGNTPADVTLFPKHHHENIHSPVVYKCRTSQPSANHMPENDEKQRPAGLSTQQDITLNKDEKGPYPDGTVHTMSTGCDQIHQFNNSCTSSDDDDDDDDVKLQLSVQTKKLLVASSKAWEAEAATKTSHLNSSNSKKSADSTFNCRAHVTQITEATSRAGIGTTPNSPDGADISSDESCLFPLYKSIKIQPKVQRSTKFQLTRSVHSHSAKNDGDAELCLHLHNCIPNLRTGSDNEKGGQKAEATTHRKKPKQILTFDFSSEGEDDASAFYGRNQTFSRTTKPGGDNLKNYPQKKKRESDMGSTFSIPSSTRRKLSYVYSSKAYPKTATDDADDLDDSEDDLPIYLSSSNRKRIKHHSKNTAVLCTSKISSSSSNSKNFQENKYEGATGPPVQRPPHATSIRVKSTQGGRFRRKAKCSTKKTTLLEDYPEYADIAAKLTHTKILSHRGGA